MHLKHRNSQWRYIVRFCSSCNSSLFLEIKLLKLKLKQKYIKIKDICSVSSKYKLMKPHQKLSKTKLDFK